MKWLRRAVVAASVLYPLVLAGAAVMLRVFGEHWWVTTVALYLPRLVFAAPLPFLILGLALCSALRWIWTQGLSAFLVGFPLMGYVVPLRHGQNGDAPKVRVLSYNINSANGGVSRLAEEVGRYSPDVVFMQEIGAQEELKREFLKSYAVADVSTQFFVASRFPILSTVDPTRLAFDGRDRSPRFMEYLIDTPIGHIHFLSVHPLSPREDFYLLRGRGLRREILSGHIFSGAAAPRIQANASLRELQVQTIREYAERSSDPVVIAGDTNLPGLSLVFGRELSRFQDGFVAAGSGFGYTYPNERKPWMRIDRILANDRLRFVEFQVGTSSASDHLCVVADLQGAN
jgi:vancomycin resistance protein VanJ